MSAPDILLKPEACVVLLVDYQAGLGCGVESAPRQTVLNNAVAVARTTAATFSVPVVVSTSASKVYSGPAFPAVQAAIPNVKPVVGHEPRLSSLVEHLLTDRRAGFLGLKKGEACYLALGNDPRPGRSEMRWLLTASQLRRLAE